MVVEDGSKYGVVTVSIQVNCSMVPDNNSVAVYWACCVVSPRLGHVIKNS